MTLDYNKKDEEISRVASDYAKKAREKIARDPIKFVRDDFSMLQANYSSTMEASAVMIGNGKGFALPKVALYGKGFSGEIKTPPPSKPTIEHILEGKDMSEGMLLYIEDVRKVAREMEAFGAVVTFECEMGIGKSRSEAFSGTKPQFEGLIIVGVLYGKGITMVDVFEDIGDGQHSHFYRWDMTEGEMKIRLPDPYEKILEY